MDASGRKLLRQLVPQVRQNCKVADAMASGRFSLCGLLMRLRNLFKWEQGIPPWEEPEPAVVLEWVSQREDEWLGLEETEPVPIELFGSLFDPFDTESLACLIEPAGLLYGAGLAGGLLPTFFLGRIRDKYDIDGLKIYVVDREYCRDLLFMAGLRQENRIYLRREPFGYLLWDRVTDPRPAASRFARWALAAYGVVWEDLVAEPGWDMLEPVIRGEMQAMLWHEIGEVASGDIAHNLLAKVLEFFPASELEHFTRAVKDLLADTIRGGRLANIIQGKVAGALCFYPTWQSGFSRLLFPEIDAVIQRFVKKPDWSQVEEARLLGLERASNALRRLDALMTDPLDEKIHSRVRSEIIEPLTGFRSINDDNT